MNRILPTNQLVDIINFDLESFSEDSIDMSHIHRGILQYYENYSDISMPTFTFNSDERQHTVDSLFMSTDETRDQFRKHTLKGSHQTVIESDLDVLDKVIPTDVFADSYYNNTKIAPVIDGDTLRAIKTDYYTTTLLSILLRIEAHIAGKKQNPTEEDFSLRQEILGEKQHLISPRRPSAGSSRGIICTKKPNGSYCLLIGKRSDSVDSAPSAISSFPAGTIEEYGATKPIKTMKREFIEEFFINVPKKGVELINSFNIEQISSGWNAKTGGVLFDFIVYSHNSDVYENIVEYRDGNGEMAELVEIPIQDVGELSDILSIDKMSGDAIHSICYALMYIDNSSEFPDLDYTISADWS